MADQGDQYPTQLQSHLDETEVLLANIERSVEWIGRNKTSENVRLISELKQAVAEIRDLLQLPVR